MVVLLCPLIGLPAAGKTSLCRALETSAQEMDVISVHVVCFDELYTSHSRDRSEDDEGAEDWDVDLWHAVRVGALAEVRRVLEQQTREDAKQQDGRHCAVVLVDDNLYFRSMRKPLFQLARELRAGYQSVFVTCDVQTCLRRNRLRSRPVPDEVILRMADKLERPDSTQTQDQHEGEGFAAFEKRSLHISTDEQEEEEEEEEEEEHKSRQARARKLLRRLVEVDAKEQLRRVPLDLARAEAEARVRSEHERKRQGADLLQQADVVLRKLVGVRCREQKNTTPKTINAVRRSILTELKQPDCRVHREKGGLPAQLAWVEEQFHDRCDAL